MKSLSNPLINTGALARCKNASSIWRVFQDFSARCRKPAVAELTALFLIVSGPALASTHYVDLNCTNAIAPYTNWATAATNIQDAVDAAVAGDEVVVTNGIYASGGDSSSRVSVNTPLVILSVNGPGMTVIDGAGVVRCAWLTTNATLSGFTLTGGFGYSSAGGVYCQSGKAIVSNCVISGNSSYFHNDSVYGGGANGVTLNNCTLSNNLARALSDHYSPAVYAYGGGAYGCTLNNCTLMGNRAQGEAYASLATAYAYGGGAYASTLNNCTLSGNGASAEYLSSIGEADLYAYGGGAASCTLNQCTLAGNSAYAYALQSCCKYRDGNGAYACALYNCIVWDNFSGNARAGDLWLRNYDSSCTLFYCSTWPQPGGGAGGITNAPLFVDTNGWADLRLQPNSPCINAGNNAFAPAGPDLDGNPRIVGGTVDIGAYEYQSLSLINFSVGSNQAGFDITGPSNQVVIVETSPDLLNWSPLATNTLNGHPFSFSDPTPATLPQRFYRAQSQ